jgi:uncharacterized protein YndB with AHSA1/START domain
MAEIIDSIDISRRPEDVFSYATDFSHLPDWQGGVVSARPEGDAHRASAREPSSLGGQALAR